MSVITDVPQSGIYYQKGAIVQLIVQLLDQQTGLPIQLQAAMSLEVVLLLPDLLTVKMFPAQLYTDGSDGLIVYTTRNDGTIIDLSQVGLYQLQGTGVIGDIQMPFSYETDFYVLKNIVGFVSGNKVLGENGLPLLAEDGTFILEES